MNQKEDKEGFTLKEKILYTLGTVTFLGGSFFLGRHFLKKGVSNQEEKKSLEEGSPSTYAKQIKMAFENDGWPGTDMIALRNTFRQIGTKEEFTQTEKSYSKLYNKSLLKDLSDELQSTQYNEMLSILAAKPEKKGQKAPLNYDAWAKRLDAAFKKTYGFIPGTDEEAIKAVFNEMPTQAAFLETAKAYTKLYNSNLISDLKSELEFWEYNDYMKIILSKPKK